jgi:hypothetical protein
MGASVVKIDTAAESRPHIVALLRQILERAELGDFSSVHIFAVSQNRESLERFAAGAYNTSEAVAALEIAKHMLINENIYT